MLIDELRDRERFTKAENEVVSYILEYPKKVTGLTIEQLATVTFSSNSSIVRVCKKVGTKGFSEFKIRLAREMSAFATESGRVEADIPIRPGESREEIANSIMNLQYQTLMDVYNMLDMNMIFRAANLIARSDIVYLYGRGESLLALTNFSADLRRIGKLSKCDTFTGFSRVYHYESSSRLKSCAVILSQFANNRELIQNFRDLMEEKIPVIIIHGNPKNVLLKQAACSICFRNEETNEKFGSFASRVVKQYILDVLYSTIFSLDYEKNVELVHRYAGKVEERNRFVNNPED